MCFVEVAESHIDLVEPVAEVGHLHAIASSVRHLLESFLVNHLRFQHLVALLQLLNLRLEFLNLRHLIVALLEQELFRHR